MHCSRADDGRYMFVGETYLRQIYNLIANNQQWIFFSMDIHETLDQQHQVEKPVFVPDIMDHTDERAKARRNPLTQYNRIGNFKIDFVSYEYMICFFKC